MHKVCAVVIQESIKNNWESYFSRLDSSHAKDQHQNNPDQPQHRNRSLAARLRPRLGRRRPVIFPLRRLPHRCRRGNWNPRRPMPSPKKAKPPTWVRTNISIGAATYRAACERLAALDYKSFSAYCEALIRQDLDARPTHRVDASESGVRYSVVPVDRLTGEEEIAVCRAAETPAESPHRATGTPGTDRP